jgi:hypothetical protein
MVYETIKIRSLRFMTGGILKVFFINGTSENISVESYYRAKKRRQKIKKLYERSNKLG